jgi:hypothetical protein
MAWLFLLLLLSFVAALIAHSCPVPEKFHFTQNADEISWRVSRLHSRRLDLRSGRQVISRTEFATGVVNQHGDGVVLRYRTNPLLRTIEVAGRRTLLLFAIEDHSIVLRNEWQIPFSVYNRNSASFDFVSFGNYFYTLNPNETFVEKRSPTDGELVATFPIPKDYLGIGGTRPNWRMIGVVLIDYSNDLRQSYVFDFVHQRALFSLDDSSQKQNCYHAYSFLR